MKFEISSERTLLGKGSLDALFPNIIRSKVSIDDDKMEITINNLKDLKDLSKEIDNLPLDISFYNSEIVIMDKCLL